MVVPFVYTEEEYKELEERIRFLEQCLDNKEEVNKQLREEISKITMVADDEKQSIEHILELEKENKSLKLTLEQMENTCKDYLNDRDTLREENKKLRERIKELEKDYDRLKVAFEDVVSGK